MQALAIFGLLAVQFGQAALVVALPVGNNPGVPAGFGPALLADPAFATLRPHPAIGVVVVGIAGPALSFDLPLQGGHLPVTPVEFGGKQPQFRQGIGHKGDGLGAYIQAYLALTQAVFGFPVGLTLAHELNVEAIAPVQLSPHQPYVLDAAVQAVLDNRVVSGNNRLKNQFAAILDMPDQLVVLPAQTTAIGLALHRIKLVLAFEAGFAALTQDVAP